MSEEELHGGGPGGGGPGGGPGGHSGGGPGGGPGGGGPGGGPGGHSGGGPGGQSGGGPGGQSGGGPGGTSGGGPGGSSRDWDAENARESAKEDADLLAAKQARAAGHVAAEDFYNTTSVPDAYGGTVQLPFRTPTGNVGPIQIPSEYSHEADAFQVGIQEQADEAQPNVKPYSGPQAGAAEPEDPEETFAEAKEKAEAYVHDSRQNQSAPDWQYKNQFEAKWGLPFPVPELDQGEQPYPGEDLARIPHDDPHTHDEVEVAD